MTRVAQIIPYFGKWPEWMPLYLYSCSRNQMIDFIFFTDCDPLPIFFRKDICNLKYYKMTFDQYKHLVSEKLGYHYCPLSTYKLTDLKPFLGLIHEDILADYDWWGFGDIDLVYGDMSMLINEWNLQRFTLITTHNYHIAGHCSFMLNNNYYKNLCLRIDDWQTRLNNAQHYGFDEAEWSALVYPAIKYPLGLYRKFVGRVLPGTFNGFMNLSNRILNAKQHFKEYFTSPVPQDKFWVYDTNTGRISTSSGKELPYLHFLFFKKTPWLNTSEFWKSGYYKLGKSNIHSYDKIIIDSNGIYAKL